MSTARVGASLSVMSVHPGDMEDALANCDATALFLNLAVAAVFGNSGDHEVEGSIRIFKLTADQVDAIAMADALVFRSIREASRAFHGMFTIGCRAGGAS